MLEDLARKYGFLALLLALVSVILFSGNGVLDYVRLKHKIEAIDNSIKRLEEENIELKGKIDRVQKDDRYLEGEARKFGFIKEGEKVYRIEK